MRRGAAAWCQRICRNPPPCLEPPPIRIPLALPISFPNRTGGPDGGALQPVSLSEVADALGTLGLFVFALTAWMSPLANHLALGLCLLALILSREARSTLAGDPVFRYGLIFGFYLLAQTLWGVAQFPETLPRQMMDCGKWCLLAFGFFVIGWWLRADPRRINLVLLAAVLGLGLGLLDQARWRDLLAFRTGDQTGFQMTAGCSGLISATVILGLLLFSGRVLGAPVGPWRKGLRIAAWGIGVYLSAYMLIASQSRTAWGAVLIVFPAVLGYRYFWIVRAQGASPRRLPLMHLLILGLMAGGLWLNKDSLLNRIGPDREAVATIMQGEEDRLPQLPESSLKYRYQVQKFGLEKWLERPWLGWGTGSTRHLIATSGRPGLWNKAAGRWISHLHSAYLEILVRFGLVGAALIAVGIWKVGTKLREAELRCRLPDDYFLLLLGSLGLTAIWASNVFQLLADQWRAYWLLLMGLGYTFALHPVSPQRKTENPA